MKKLSFALMLITGSAMAQTAPSVPAITTALNADTTGVGNPVPLPQPAVTGQEPVLQTAYIQPSFPKEKVSPTVQKVRDKFDKEQRAQVAEYITDARQVPTSKNATNVGGQTIYTYRNGGIYTIYTGAGRITDIALQPGEVVTGEIQGGDTVRWSLAQVSSGTETGEQIHIIVKATEPGLSNDIFIPTNKRSYLLNVRSVADWHMPSVSWNYPLDTWKQQQIAMQKKEAVIPVSGTPESLHFDYKIKGSKRKTKQWQPVQVFDDGKQTYIRMPSNLNSTDAPALFIVENGEPLMVNYRIKGVADGSNGPTYVVDRLFNQAELRVGADSKVIIQRR